MIAGVIVGLGHDIQSASELQGKEALWTPGLVFTAAELARIETHSSPTLAAAGIFSAKEAFFKAAPLDGGWCWSDLAVARGSNRRPILQFGGELGALLAERPLQVDLSISHSGDYASSVVIFSE